MAKILDGEIVPNTIEEYRNRLQSDWGEILGADYIFNDQTIQGQIIGLISNALNRSDESHVASWSASRLSTASGQQLDMYGELLGIPRNQGRFVVAFVEFTGEVGVIVPVGTRVRSTTGVVLQTTVRTQIPSTGKTGRTRVTSLNRGRFPVAAREINNIIDSANGLTGVNNPDAARFQGEDPETDNDYRIRLQRAKSTLQGTAEGLKARLVALDGCTDAIVTSNDKPTAETVQGVTIQPESIFCAVLKDSERDDISDATFNQAVANEIFRHKSLGIPTDGAISQEVKIDPALFPHTIKFSLITETAIKVNVRINRDNEIFPPDGLTIIGDGIFRFLTNFDTPLTVGRTLDVNSLYGFVYSVPGATLNTIAVTDTNDVALPNQENTPLLTVYRISRDNVSVTAL